MSHSTRTSILDAAKSAVIANGWQRATMADIARRAGVSRMTLYRNWPDVGALLRDLSVREWSVTSFPEGDDISAGSVAAGVLRSMLHIAQDELYVAVVTNEPEVLLPYLIGRQGRASQIVHEKLTATLAAGQERGRIRAGDPALLAATIQIVTEAYTVHRAGAAAEGATEPADTDDHEPDEPFPRLVSAAAQEELTLMLERYLTP